MLLGAADKKMPVVLTEKCQANQKKKMKMKIKRKMYGLLLLELY